MNPYLAFRPGPRAWFLAVWIAVFYESADAWLDGEADFADGLGEVRPAHDA